MRPRLLVVLFAAGAAWLFLTEGGRRRRGQVMSLLGRAPSDQEGSNEPLPFPQPWAGSSAGGTTATPTPEDAAPAPPAPAPAPVAIDATAAATAPTPEETATATPAADDRAGAPATAAPP